MQLITEYTDNINTNVITESRDGKPRKHLIEGVFLQADVKNHNGRIYPKAQLRNSVDIYIDEQVSKDRAVGELTHTDTPIVDYNRVSHKITELHWEGNEVIGTADVLNTPTGKILKELIDAKVKFGVSSRGVGNVTNRQNAAYVDDFSLRAIDVVHNPSAPNAYVDGILENVEWIFDENGNLVPRQKGFSQKEVQLVENLKTEHQLKTFNDWLMNL